MTDKKQESSDGQFWRRVVILLFTMLTGLSIAGAVRSHRDGVELEQLRQQCLERVK